MRVDDEHVRKIHQVKEQDFMSKENQFRYAERKDTSLILQLIWELADYEKILDEVAADESTLECWLFDEKKRK